MSDARYANPFCLWTLWLASVHKEIEIGGWPTWLHPENFIVDDFDGTIESKDRD